MGEIAEGDEPEHIDIARDHLSEQLRMEVGEDTVEHRPGIGESMVAEEYPAEGHEMECQQHRHESTQAMAVIATVVMEEVGAQPLVQSQRHTVHAAPRHEVQACSMPETAKQHGDNQIEVCAHASLAVTSQGDVDIVANPRRERDVPPTPEVGDALRAVGSVEVQGEAESQEQGDANGHVAVAGEVAVNLKRVAVDTQQVLHTAVERGIVEDAVDEVQRDIVADDGFLEQAHGNEADAPGKHVVGNLQRAAYLRGKVAGTDDGSGDELREERHVERIVEQRRQRLQVTPVDVDDVAHRLEGEKRYAHRQEDVVGLEIAAHHLLPHAAEEIGVLEIAQQPQVDEQRECHQRPSCGSSVLQPVDARGNEIIAQRHHGKQEEIEAAGLIIEVIGEGRDKEQSQRARVLQHHVDKGKPQEQEQEQPATEEHRLVRMIGQLVDDTFNRRFHRCAHCSL